MNRQTVSLAEHPDLVVIYLGVRMNSLRGIRPMTRLKFQITKAVKRRPEGLLRHEWLLYQPFPFHIGMRQYWRDLDTLESWTRELPHQDWWREFVQDSGGMGFWHETYLLRGGMECIYDDIPKPTGMLAFAEKQTAVGPMFSSRNRLGRGDAAIPVLSEREVVGH